MEEKIKENNQNLKYISLYEAAKLCSYSEPYLRLRARTGKLKSIKLGKKWMTTTAWLDDYAARVQEWRDLSEAKKAQLPATVFVAAPQELIDNMAEEKQVVPAPTRTDAGIADFNLSVLDVPKPAVQKRFAAMPMGQIIPAPRQTLIRDDLGHNWLIPVLSGAVIALILFLAVMPGGAGNIINLDYERIMKADIYQAALSDEMPVPQKAGRDGSAGFFTKDSLQNLVDWLAGYFNR